jgi:aminopeptidase
VRVRRVRVRFGPPHSAVVELPSAPAESTLGGLATRFDLAAPAEAAVDCLAVGPTESVPVVCNAEQRLIAAALAAASKARARAVTVLEFATLSRHGEEPPAEVAEAMARADVVFASSPTVHAATRR